MNRRVITALVAGSLCLLAGCTSNASNPSNTSASENTETTKTSITAVTPIVTGYEWGPAVSSVIIELDEPVSSIDSSKAAIRTNQNERTISNAVLVDESGKETTDKSQFIRSDANERETFHIHLKEKPEEYWISPLFFGFHFVWRLPIFAFTLSSAFNGLTSVFEMGTGVTHWLASPYRSVLRLNHFISWIFQKQTPAST